MQQDLFTSPVVETKHRYHYAIDGRIVKTYEMTDERAAELNQDAERSKLFGRYVRADNFRPKPEKRFKVQVERKQEW